jgi:outer membrane protein OmpA-like peptidoglycan-associated protein
MTTPSKIRLALGAALLLGAFTPSSASATPLQLELGAFGGWHYFARDNQLGRDVGSTDENRLKQSGTFGLRLGFIVHPLVDLEAELGLTPTSAEVNRGTPAAMSANALALNYRAHLLVHVLKGKIRPFLLVGGGGNSISSGNTLVLKEDTDGEFHAGVGLKADIQKNWGIRLDGRLYVVPTVNQDRIYATSDFEVLLGFYGLFGGAKEALKPIVVVVAPPPNPDLDGDGILNANDLCPTEKGVPENRGCPDRDSDGDLIVDRLDRCPQDKGVEETGGCPDKDGDGDKIVDRKDKCPEAAGPPENDGCPDTDTDKDGVPDRLDKCPTEAETVNNYKDTDGCADELPKEVKKYTGAVKGINFVTGKADLLPTSNKVLDDITKVLKDYPDVKIEIDGHTDDVGERNANIDLSKARAESVRKYFIDHGVPEARMTANGFGPDKPVADNKTKAGKAKNRRVEIKLVN